MDMATRIKQNYPKEIGFRPHCDIQKIEPIPRELTKEQRKLNDSDHIPMRNVFGNIGVFLPELANKDSNEILSFFMDKFRENPSVSNHMLAQNAINNITSLGALDADTKQVVKEAIDELTGQKPEKIKKKDAKIDSIWATLFENPEVRWKIDFPESSAESDLFTM